MKLKLSPHPCGTIFWLICPETLTNLPGLCKVGSPPSGFLNYSMIPRNIANCRGHLPEWQTDRLSANKKPLQATLLSPIHWTWLGQRVHVFTAWFLSPLPRGTDLAHRLVRKPEQWKWPLSLNLRPEGAPTTAARCSWKAARRLACFSHLTSSTWLACELLALSKWDSWYGNIDVFMSRWLSVAGYRKFCARDSRRSV